MLIRNFRKKSYKYNSEGLVYNSKYKLATLISASDDRITTRSLSVLKAIYDDDLTNDMYMSLSVNPDDYLEFNYDFYKRYGYIPFDYESYSLDVYSLRPFSSMMDLSNSGHHTDYHLREELY